MNILLVDGCQDYTSAFRLAAMAIGHSCHIENDWRLVASHSIPVCSYDLVVIGDIFDGGNAEDLANKYSNCTATVTINGVDGRSGNYKPRSVDEIIKFIDAQAPGNY